MAFRNMLPDIWKGSSVWNPGREAGRLQRQVDRMFDEFLSSTFPGMAGPARSLKWPGEGAYSPPCDVQETDTHYLVSFDLPGIKKDDLKIDLRDNLLTVSGERKEGHREEKASRISEECYYGSFLRSFALPSNVDVDKVEAGYENGVLSVAIPKTHASKAKQISIKEGKLLEKKAA